MANQKRIIEIFSADCPLCHDVIRQVQAAACPSCDVHVLDMSMPNVQRRAEDLGVKSVPAVAVNGILANCCSNRGVDLDVLRSAGLGQPTT